MKIFLTGITGLVGSGFTTRFLQTHPGVDIVCLTRGATQQDAEARVKTIIEDQCAFDGCPEVAEKILPHITVIAGDVTSLNPEAMSQDPRLKDVDIVFHCAADVNLGKDPDGKVFRINFNGTQNVVELAKRLNVKAIHYVGTAYVAGKLKGRAMENTPINSGFNNAYEESKFKAEMLVRESGIPFTIYRPAIVVGRSSDGRIRKPLAVYRILELLGKFKVHACTKHKLNPFEKTDLKLHFETMSSEQIYFVPIDLVQNAIVALYDFPVENKAYHLTGNTPTSTRLIDRMVTKILRTEQLFYGDGEKFQNGSKDEQVAERLIGDLYPYFATKIEFDQTNIQAALGSRLDKYQFTQKSLEMMMRSFYKDFFKNVPWMIELMDSVE